MNASRRSEPEAAAAEEGRPPEVGGAGEGDRSQEAGALPGVTVVLPGQLREVAGGETALRLEGRPATVAEALAHLRAAHPAVHHRLVTEQGELRPHINVFVGQEEIRRTGGLDTELAGEAEILVLPAVSGG